MTSTRTMTATTTRASQKITRGNPAREPVQNLGTTVRSRSGLTKGSRKSGKPTNSRYRVQKRGCYSINGDGIIKQGSEGSFRDQARRKSSSGSSTNPTGSSGSRGESNYGGSFVALTRPDRALRTTARRSLTSDPSHDSKLERIIQSLPGSFPRVLRRRPKPRITIARPFTDFGVSYSRRSISSIEDRIKNSFVRSQVLRNEKISDIIQSSSLNDVHEDSSSPKIVRLSPGSLRKARLMVLDRKPSPSSTSFAPLLENDRRDSTFLPRQHYCEPDVRGHHSAPDRQKSILRTSAEQNGSPDPDSPSGGDGSISPGHNRRRGSRGPHFSIANMRVAAILRLRTKESYCIEIIHTSRLRKLPLDEVTKARIEEIARRKHGSTLIGIGPWNKVVSYGDDLVWNNWCCLSTSPLTNLEDNGVVPAGNNNLYSDEQRAWQPSCEDIIIVPLIDAQVKLLHGILEKSNSSL